MNTPFQFLKTPPGQYVFASLILAGGLVFTTSASAETLDADTIAKKSNHAIYYQSQAGRADVKMEIVDAQGNKRKRKFVILRRNKSQTDGDQSYFVYFKKPADIARYTFLVQKKIKKDDDRWLYLPAMDLVKRIAASDTRSSFMGSHFYYEDVSGRGLEEDTHELLKTTKNYYVIKNTPKKPDSVEFSSYKMFIHKKSFLPVSVEYYDKNNKKYREYKALKVKTIDGVETVTKALMKDLNSGGQTKLSYTKVRFKLELPDSIFTERYLRSPPMEYLK